MEIAWINPDKRRYYNAHLTPDLLGGAAVVHCWGGLDSRLGGARKCWYADAERAREALQALDRRRKKRGYERRSTPE